MHDDELMDRLLRDAMAGDPPQVSPAFDAQVMARIRPPRLTPIGRLVIAIYVAIATMTAVWLMRELPVEWIALAVLGSVSIAAAASAYGRRVAFGD